MMSDTLEKLLLDRLLEEVKRPILPLQQEAEKLRLELATTRARADRLAAELHKHHQAETPFRNLFLACEEMVHAKTSHQSKRARARLSKALRAADQHVDKIPF